MNPYFAISAIFLLGLRGIEKKLALPSPPISSFTPEQMEQVLNQASCKYM
jgi:glutamine synthetase